MLYSHYLGHVTLIDFPVGPLNLGSEPRVSHLISSPTLGSPDPES